ncbi:MAG: 4-hydroxy-tetrahydrodipicolinate reductase [Bdellovibrionales bacterium]|nr:4-hydroxy-tetrahydrodipicolinate reductase [Bdellovibrionales bacterium]
MVRLVVLGASGRMGHEVLSQIEQDGEVKLIATVDPNGKTSAAQITDIDATRCDGVIDFSTPTVTLKTSKWCAQYKKFLVSGTTGLSLAQQRALAVSAKKTPILWAPNLSLGVAAFKKALSALSGLEGYDFQIEELHHKHKVDQPSGTAIDLQKELVRVVGKKVPPPISIRGGGIKGVHRVWAMGEGEVLTFEHVALDRAIFARGAIKSAKWLFAQKKTSGLYSVEDLWESQNPN